jgi:CheY-like chemotaxis protein
MPARKKEPPRLDGILVLVVDDDEGVRDSLKAALEAYGAIVSTAGSSREALEVLARFRPHVIVTDLMMPGEDGYWLLDEVKKHATPTRTIPVIALTAGDDPQRALEAGFLEFFRKPPALDDLCRAIMRGTGSRGTPPAPS